MYDNAPANVKLTAKAENIKPNLIASYQYGTSTTGQWAGHVIYIEGVIGDTVYYTEGGSGYHKNGTDGVLKTATKDQIINGTGIGSGLKGFIDMDKY